MNYFQDIRNVIIPNFQKEREILIHRNIPGGKKRGLNSQRL